MNENFTKMVRTSGKSLYKINKETGIPYTTLSELFTGKKSVNHIAAQTVYKLCLYFNCDMSELLNNVFIMDNISGVYEGYKYIWKNNVLSINDKNKHIHTFNLESINTKHPFKFAKCYAESVIDELIIDEEEEKYV